MERGEGGEAANIPKSCLGGGVDGDDYAAVSTG